MQAEYYIKDIYGEPLLYPANDAAKAVCNLTNKKTLDQRVMSQSQALGLTWVQVMRPIK